MLNSIYYLVPDSIRCVPNDVTHVCVCVCVYHMRTQVGSSSDLWAGCHCGGTARTKANTSVSCDDHTTVLFSLCCERVRRAHLSLSHLGWPSWVSPSPSRSRPCTAADPPSGQTRHLFSAAGRTRSSRSSSGGKCTPKLASQTLLGQSSPCTRCTWLQTT